MPQDPKKSLKLGLKKSFERLQGKKSREGEELRGSDTAPDLPANPRLGQKRKVSGQKSIDKTSISRPEPGTAHVGPWAMSPFTP